MKKGLLAVLCAMFAASLALADDWPQFRGADRSGVSKEKGLLKVWPKGGPTLSWTFKDAGLGFSSVAVVKGVVYTLGTDQKFQDEYVIAIDEKKGAELWRAKIGPVAVLTNNVWGDGPRSAPTIDGNFLYALGSQGELICIDLANKNQLVWSKNLIKDLGGKVMDAPGFPDGWGFSESPLVDGKFVICTPGGAQGTMAALEKTTGKVMWRSKGLTLNAPYSSPVVAEIHGVRQYIQTAYENTDGKEFGIVAGFKADTGEKLWSQEIFNGQSYAIAATPVVNGNKVYVTVGYTRGCQLIEINKKQEPKVLFKPATAKKVKNAHGGVILIDGHIYGHSDSNRWICQDLANGALEWDERNQLSCASGTIVGADGKLYLYTDDGEVGLVDADPKNFNLISKFTIPVKSTIPQNRKSSRSSQIWANPAIANGHLYLRDNEFIFAYKITK